jgi:hypothetical protein
LKTAFKKYFRYENLLTPFCIKVSEDNVYGSTNQGAILARVEGQGALLTRREVAGAQGVSQCIKHKLNVIGAAQENTY